MRIRLKPSDWDARLLAILEKGQFVTCTNLAPSCPKFRARICRAAGMSRIGNFFIPGPKTRAWILAQKARA